MKIRGAEYLLGIPPRKCLRRVMALQRREVFKFIGDEAAQKFAQATLIPAFKNGSFRG